MRKTVGLGDELDKLAQIYFHNDTQQNNESNHGQLAQKTDDLDQKYVRCHRAKKLAEMVPSSDCGGNSFVKLVEQARELADQLEETERLMGSVSFVLKIKKNVGGSSLTEEDACKPCVLIENITGSLLTPMKFVRALTPSEQKKKCGERYRQRPSNRLHPTSSCCILINLLKAHICSHGRS